MQIAVIIEPLPGTGFRARTGEPLSITAEASTSDEALSKVRRALAERLSNGIRVAAIELPTRTDPWKAMAGCFRDNPMFDEVVDIIERHRTADENDPDYL